MPRWRDIKVLPAYFSPKSLCKRSIDGLSKFKSVRRSFTMKRIVQFQRNLRSTVAHTWIAIVNFKPYISDEFEIIFFQLTVPPLCIKESRILWNHYLPPSVCTNKCLSVTGIPNMVADEQLYHSYMKINQLLFIRSLQKHI